MEPMARIELATSPLPRECSATELHGHARCCLNSTVPRSTRNQYQPTSNFSLQLRTGAGEGNRTLVVSLEGFCSTIELHPHLATDLDDLTCCTTINSSEKKSPCVLPCPSPPFLRLQYAKPSSSRARLETETTLAATDLVEGEGFEPSKAEPSDLQSDPFDRSGTPPNETANFECFGLISQRGFKGF
jgi:hypothetical protein